MTGLDLMDQQSSSLGCPEPGGRARLVSHCLREADPP